MADASDSKSDVGDNVWVQVPPPAPKERNAITRSFFCADVVEYFAALRGVRSLRSLG